VEGFVSWINTPQLLLLERYLDVMTMRQTLVSTNVANVDTPGYHTRDVDFRGELMRAMNGEDTSLTSPFVVPVRGLVARPDGNNVSADREGMLLAEVQLQFKAAAAIIRARFAGLSTAIREGQ
jgi:flagellar basal-body rod protein FlgB